MTPSRDEPTDDPNGEPTPDLDAAFDAIVSNLRHGDRPPVVPDYSAIEDDDSPSDSVIPAPEEPRLGSQWSGWEDLRLEPPPEHDERGPDDHYEPPPPPPVPRGDRVVRWAWAGAVGAPVLALVLAFVGWNLAGMVGALLVAAFLGGFVTLISRLRPDRTMDDDPDDGAVI